MVEQREPAELVPGAAAGRRRPRSPSSTKCAGQATSAWPATRRTCCCCKPRDAYRYGYRLWSDKASGLLLRADVLGERGEVLETSAFSDCRIGVQPQPEAVLQPMKKLDGYRVLRPVLTPTHLEAEGWTMRQAVPGFRQVSCVKRPMDGAGDDGAGAAAGAADDLLRRPDLRVGVHRAVQRRSATRRPMHARHGRDADVDAAAGRLVDHRGRRRARGDAARVRQGAGAQK